MYLSFTIIKSTIHVGTYTNPMVWYGWWDFFTNSHGTAGICIQTSSHDELSAIRRISGWITWMVMMDNLDSWMDNLDSWMGNLDSWMDNLDAHDE